MVVHPGDIIVGDEDGVLAIPVAEVEAVIAAAKKQGEKEAVALQSIARGEFDRSWVVPHETRMMGG
jgi:regulator of RNase E activity RraA